MNTNILSRKSEIAERAFNRVNLNQINIVEVSLIEEKTDVKQQDEPIVPNGETLLTPIYFVTFTLLLMVLKSFKSCKAGKNQIATFNHSNQISCKNCRFFNHNYYLKCAVHPDAALKSEEINCHDYHPQNNTPD